MFCKNPLFYIYIETKQTVYCYPVNQGRNKPVVSFFLFYLYFFHLVCLFESNSIYSICQNHIRGTRGAERMIVQIIGLLFDFL